jgi:hypothetical protein
MKTILTTAAIITALALPALAEGDDPSAKQGEAKGNLKATTTINSPPAGSNAMGQGQMMKRSTTGASNQGADELPGNRTGVSGGDSGRGGPGGSNDSGSSSGSSGGSGSGSGSR